METRLGDYKDLKLKLEGIVPPGQRFPSEFVVRRPLQLTTAGSAGKGANIERRDRAGRLHKLASSQWRSVFRCVAGHLRGPFSGRRADQSESWRVLFRVFSQIPPWA